MKFMPRSRATRTERNASLKSTGRNSWPSDEAPKLSEDNCKPVRPSGRNSMSLMPRTRRSDTRNPRRSPQTHRNASSQAPGGASSPGSSERDCTTSEPRVNCPDSSLGNLLMWDRDPDGHRSAGNGHRETRSVARRARHHSAEQRTPLVEALLRVIEQLLAANEQLQATVQQQQLRIEQLEDEIRRLKGLPEQPKRKPKPSPLNDPSGPPSASGEKKKPNTPDGKRPGSAKRSKTRDLVIHDDVPLPLDGLPDGTKFLGYLDFTVQDLKVEPHNTRYRRGRYQLPDGTIVTAPLPQDVTSHFGPTLRQYVLYQHFHNHVTQPLLHEELLELGVDISAGQVNRLLTEGHEAFHQEKDSSAAGRPRGLGVPADRRHVRQAPGQRRAHAAHRQRLVRLVLHDRHQEPGELPEDSAHASSGLPVQRRRLVLPRMLRGPPKTPRATATRHGLALRGRRILGSATRCVEDRRRRNSGGW